jgi:hypothetical protein
MSSAGWEKLLCSYFYTICLKVLSAYFSGHGFVPVKNNIGGITFRKRDIFVEISYDPESSPKYSLTVVVGIGSGAYDDWGKFTGVPIWSLIPEDNVESEFFAWTFSDEKELGNILTKTKTMVLEKYAKPLWQDRSKLENEAKKFTS